MRASSMTLFSLVQGLSPEQLEKARACRSSEELFQLAKEEGLELNDAQLEAVAGGSCDPTPQNNCGTLPKPTGPRYRRYDFSNKRRYPRCSKHLFIG